MFRVGVLTVSDSAFKGTRPDKSGPLIAQMVTDFGYTVACQQVLPDEQDRLEAYLSETADSGTVDLLLTTGGTGFSPRDVTPEATLAVCHRMAPGIPTAICQFSLSITPRAMLSRAAAGIRGKTLIVNLPGSPKAVEETVEYLLPSLDHGLEILTGRASDCARK